MKLMSRKTNIIAFCQSRIPSAEVGVIKPFEQASRVYPIEFRYMNTGQITAAVLTGADVVVCIRGADSLEADMVREARRLGKYTIYYLDDDLLSIPQTAGSYEYFSSPIVSSSITALLSAVDCMWTNSVVIQRNYAQYAKKIVRTEAPALLLDAVVSRAGTHDGPVVVGYAGGKDHEIFINQLLEEPIRRLIDRYGEKVKFEFMGACPKFVNQFGLNYYAYESDYGNYIKKISSLNWDIGLAPLENSPFHSSKYINKFLEYGSLHMAGAYSNVMPYAGVIKPGYNGVLASNDEQGWFDSISALIDDKLLRDRIQKNAREQLERDYSVQTVSEQIVSNVPELIHYRAPDSMESDIRIELGQRVLLTRKMKDTFVALGPSAPWYILRKIGKKLFHR